MSTPAKIKINNTTYPIKFGYGAIRILGIYLGKPSYDETVKEVQRLLSVLTDSEKAGTPPPFAISDGLGFVIKSGLEFANPDDIFDNDDLCQAYLTEPEILKTVFECFMDAMPKPKISADPLGKNRAPQKARAKKKG
jgi:hypothetical protein